MSVILILVTARRARYDKPWEFGGIVLRLKARWLAEYLTSGSNP